MAFDGLSLLNLEHAYTTQSTMKKKQTNSLPMLLILHQQPLYINREYCYIELELMNDDKNKLFYTQTAAFPHPFMRQVQVSCAIT